jgi:cytochrome c oxidase accessory protein FixG
VLATLNADGRRRWLTPRLSKGYWYRLRQVVAYGLIALFVTLPWIRIGGSPALLLDVPARQFTILGKVFYPTDTLLLAIGMVGLFLTIFFVTAVLGRAWCGWACPQTVYLEWVFRPIERFFTRTTGRGGRPRKVEPWRRVAMFAVFAVFSFFIANTFLAYFVGTDRLTQWVVGSPLNHPFGFGLVLVVTGAMLFNFGFFREQLCHIACPYGRMQSVMLDRRSLIVSYDEERGEPRGAQGTKARRHEGTKGPESGSDPSSLRDSVSSSLPTRGDCIDCTLCVQVCPMGIDIRDGLQMECVHCTQCIDACVAVMARIDKPPGLIGYASAASRAGEKRAWLRPRVVIYPAALLILGTLFVVVLAGKGDFDASFVRSLGQPYTLGEDDVRNSLRLRLVNRTAEPRTYRVSTAEPGVTVIDKQAPVRVAPGETVERPVHLITGLDAFENGNRRVELVITDDTGHTETRRARLLGPMR